MKKNITGLIILAVIIVVLGGFWAWSAIRSRNSANYYPRINPKQFSVALDNPYFTLKPKTTYLYERETPDGVERTAIWLTGETRMIIGVTTTGIQRRVFVDNRLRKNLLEWYAQDRSGNVWLFGRTAEYYELGQSVSTAGSWEADGSGSQPGIMMEGNPQVGDTYRQGYRDGTVEDMGDVIAIDQGVTVPFGKYAQCIRTRDWSAIDQRRNEYNIYCRDLGFLAQINATGVEAEQAGLVTTVPE